MNAACNPLAGSRVGRPFAVSVALLLVLPPPATAQDRPDFAGMWSAASGGPGPGSNQDGSLGSGWGTAFLIRQSPATLSVERAFFTRSDIQPSLEFRYALDGAETVNTVFMGRGFQQQRSTTAWRGDTLIITTVHEFEHPETGAAVTTDVTQTLSLARARLPAWPPSLIVETTRTGALGGPPSSTRTIYIRN
jgi:hypothetical protein